MQSFQFTNERGEPIQVDPISYEIGREAKRAYNRAYMREWRKTHPLNAEQRRKDNARSYAKEYLKRGKLTREPCVICGAPAEMHHPNYSEPLLVVWLCRDHHLSMHRQLGDCEMEAFVWTGEAMVPVRLQRASKTFVKDRRYWLDEVSERSWISHKQEFAFIAEAWNNLPHSMAEMFPTPEHLRKAALIATGWHRETIIDAGNRTAATRVAIYARGEDEFARVVVRGSTVVVQKARSQRMHGHDRMDKAEFQKSKTDILVWIAELLDVEPAKLQGAAA